MTRWETKVVVGNARGVHGRVATRLVEIAANNKVRLTLCRNGDCTDSAAILEVLALALVQGTEITLCAEGERAEAALAAAVSVLVGQDDD